MATARCLNWRTLVLAMALPSRWSTSLAATATKFAAGLISDAAGDLFGMTDAGGASGYGTVFEMVKSGLSYSAPVTLASFDGDNGAYTWAASLIMDAAGDLFGTTADGGANGSAQCSKW